MPDIELTEGGIYVSAATMDEVEAEARARGDGKTMIGMVWWSFHGPTYIYEGQP